MIKQLDFPVILRFLLWFVVGETVFLAAFSLLYLLFGTWSVLLIVTVAFALTSVLQTVIFADNINFSLKKFIRNETASSN